MRSAVVISLRDGDELAGALVLGSSAVGAFSARDRAVLTGVGAQLSLAIANARLFEDIRRLHLGNLRALSSALNAKDYYTLGHTTRVAAYAVLLAGELGWPAQAVREVEEVAYLHDVGKLGVSDRVLLKAGPLTSEEWALMREHPVISAEIAEPLLSPRLLGGVRHHHERYDGTGYPDGLSGPDIPEIARLLCVVDCYDAMSSRRVYRRALSYDECLAELHRCSGTQFDPTMVDALLRVLRRLAAQQQLAAAAASEAAARIDAAKHAVLREPADARRPEYGEVLAVLRDVAAAHPEVDDICTGVPVDGTRYMLVVDADDNPATKAGVGTVIFADDIHRECLAGRPATANIVTADPWGTWVSAAVPIRDARGTIVGLVDAALRPAGIGAAVGLANDVVDAFAGVARTAAARITRAEVDAVTDWLSGLYNHGHFQQELARAAQHAAEHGTTLALLFGDVDGFKQFNDRFGHPAGDEALRRIAEIVSASVRRDDVAARYGGDEFAVVLPAAGAEAAAEAAERIRARVEAETFGPDESRLTLSIGIAVLPEDAADRNMLLEAADAAMYRAKGLGRNRCERALPPDDAADCEPAAADAGRKVVALSPDRHRDATRTRRRGRDLQPQPPDPTAQANDPRQSGR